jgi:hypothetical protein
MSTIKAGIHGLIAAALASFAMSTVEPEVGYTDEERGQIDRLLTATQPVVLTKGGHVIYDSKSRAEIIGMVWNVTPSNMDSFKRWGF